MDSNTGNEIAASLRAAAEAVDSLIDEVHRTSALIDFGGFVFGGDDEDAIWYYSNLTPERDAKWPVSWPTWVPSILDKDNWIEELYYARHAAEEYAFDTDSPRPNFVEPIEQAFKAAFAGKAPDWMRFGKLSSDALGFRDRIDSLRMAIVRCEQGLSTAPKDWITAINKLTKRSWREHLLRHVIDPLKYWPSRNRSEVESIDYPQSARQYLKLTLNYPPQKRWRKLSGTLRRHAADAEACRYSGRSHGDVSGAASLGLQRSNRPVDSAVAFGLSGSTAEILPTQQAVWTLESLEKAVPTLDKTDSQMWAMASDLKKYQEAVGVAALQSQRSRGKKAAHKAFGVCEVGRIWRKSENRVWYYVPSLRPRRKDDDPLILAARRLLSALD